MMYSWIKCLALLFSFLGWGPLNSSDWGMCRYLGTREIPGHEMEKFPLPRCRFKHMHADRGHHATASTDHTTQARLHMSPLYINSFSVSSCRWDIYRQQPLLTFQFLLWRGEKANWDFWRWQNWPWRWIDLNYFPIKVKSTSILFGKRDVTECSCPIKSLLGFG